MKNQPEFQLQKQVCEYLRLKKLLFVSDVAGSLKLTMGQAKRNKSIQCGGFHCPDIMILEPRKGQGALFIELKAKSPYKADGSTLLKNEHVENQWRSILELRIRGYKADFAWTFEMAKKQIDDYLKI